MPVPVKVRLSAEGQQDVVRAFRNFEKEAKKAGKGAATGVGLVNKALIQLRTLLPAIGIATAVLGFRRLSQSTRDYVDQIQKATQRTGSSAEVLSVLTNAASKADLEQAKLNNSLSKLARNLDEAKQGTLEYKEATDRLGINLDDLSDNTGENFLVIANKLGKMKDGSEKSALAIALLGRSGAELIPLMNDLAGEGFEKARIEAERLGLVLSEDIINAAAAVKDSITGMQNRMTGFTVQLQSGFGPQFATMMNEFVDVISGDGTTALATFGAFFGRTLRTILGVLTLTSLELQLRFAELFNALISIGAVASKLIRLDFSGAKQESADFVARDIALRADFGARKGIALAGIKDALVGDTPKFSRSGTDNTGGSTDTETTTEAAARKSAESSAKAAADKQAAIVKATAAARLGQLKVTAAAELATLKEMQTQAEAQDKASADAGLITQADLFNRKRERLIQFAEAELQVLADKLARAQAMEVADEGERAKREADISKAKQDLALAELKQRGKLAALEQDRKTQEAATAKATEDSLTDMLVGLTDQTKSISDIFDNLFKNILDGFIKMIARIAAQKIIAGGGNAGGIVGGFSKILGLAEGGLVTGPGTSTSDSVPIRASSGEYMVRAAVVARPGMLQALTELNRGAGRPITGGIGPLRLASGGPVTQSASGVGGGSGPSELRLVADGNALDMTLREWLTGEAVREALGG